MFLSKSLLLGAIIPFCNGVLLPRPDAEFQVALNIAELVDGSRPDPWEMDTIPNRRIMISRFDPVAPNDCYRNEKVTYMPPITAAAEDEILFPYGWPKGVLSTIDMVFCTTQNSTPPATPEAPIVLFSPGLNTTRLYYSVVAQEIASRGFTVITIDHPFETDIVEFPDGSIAYGGNVNKTDNEGLVSALDIRADDASFVLDTLGVKDGDEVVMAGHSFGGAATPGAMLKDSRIRGGVNIDGMMFGGVIDTGLGDEEQSFVLWGSDGHNTTSDESWGDFRSVIQEQGNWERELSVKGSAHGSFWDLTLSADVAEVRDQLSEEEAAGLIGLLSGDRVMEMMGAYLNDFFRFVLEEDAGEGLLAGPSPEFPEVAFLE